MRIIDIFRTTVVDVSPSSYAGDVTGSHAKIEAYIDVLKPIGIKEIVRTGKISIARGGAHTSQS